MQIGRWLKTNGEAIYGTKPENERGSGAKATQPKLETGEFMTRYEVTDYVERKKPGQAVIEAFFTSKGNDLYAIVPGIAGKRFVLKNATAKGGASVELLGLKGA